MRTPLEFTWRSAMRGARIWSIFGLIETGLGLGLAALVPAMVPRESSLWSMTLLVALVYPIVGAGLGAIAGLLSLTGRRRMGRTDRPSEDLTWIDALVTLSVIGAIAATLAFGDAGRRTALLFGAGSLVLAAVVIARAMRPRRTGLVHACGSIWFVSLISAGVLHLTLSTIARGGARQAFAAAAVWVVLVSLATIATVLLSSRLSPSTGVSQPRPRAARVGAHLLAWPLLLLLTWAGDEGIVRADAAAPAAAARAGGGPNVVLITMDTVRGDHASAHGYARPTTPHLDALAREAARYTAAIATGNLTLTSHASIFTGRYASSHRAIPPAQPLPPDVPSLPELLGAAGYRSAAVVSNRVYLHPSMGLARGFQFYDYRVPGIRQAPRPLRLPRDVVVVISGAFGGVPGTRPPYRAARDITQEALRWLDAHLSDTGGTRRPFFLFLNYMDAHTPYAPPPSYRARFARSARVVSSPEYQSIKRDAQTHTRRMTEDERTALVDAYDGGIAYVDDEIGRVVAALRERQLFENTLLIVTSDHGEAFDEHGVVEHGRSLYQHQVRVPLIVKYPGQHIPDVIPEPVSGVDLLPTILDAVGQPHPDGMDGRSLLRRGGGATRYVFAEGFTPDGRVERAAFDRDGRKLILDAAGAPQLFDLTTDPDEQRDVQARFPADTVRLSAAIRAAFDDIQAPMTTPTPDAGVLERLRSLGYVQ